MTEACWLEHRRLRSLIIVGNAPFSHRLCPALAAYRKPRQKANTWPREDGEKVECRSNICLETHEIGCETSTAVCLQRVETDRERVGDTDKEM